MAGSPEIISYERFREESFKEEESVKKQKSLKKNSIVNYFKVGRKPEQVQANIGSESSEDDEVSVIDLNESSDESCIITEDNSEPELIDDGKGKSTGSSRPVRQASINARKAMQDFKSYLNLHPRHDKKISKEHTKKLEKNSDSLAPIFIKKTTKNAEKSIISKEKHSFLFSGLPEVVKKAQDAMLNSSSDCHYFSSCSHHGKDLHVYSLNSSDILFNRVLDNDIHYNSTFTKELNGYFRVLRENLSTWEFSIDKFFKELDCPPRYKHLLEVQKHQNQLTEPSETLLDTCAYVHSCSKKRKISLNRHGKKKIKHDPEHTTVSASSPTNLLWVDKYNPRLSSQVIGNTEAVKTVKTWLRDWKLKCEVELKSEISSGESDFSGDENQLVNSLVLVGPAGVGKTSLVYALGEELGFEVFEVNYGTSGGGKQILQQLKEATQSHQIRTSKTLSLFQNKKSTLEPPVESHPYSLILFDEVDLAWEDPEDSFLRSVNSFMESSKRPVILTCNKYYPLKSGHNIINLEHPSKHDILSYMTILCRLEGKLICSRELSQMISAYEGDIRKTMLEIQAFSSLYYKVQNEEAACDLMHISPLSLQSLQNAVKKLQPLEYQSAHIYQEDIAVINLERFLKYPLEEARIKEPDFFSHLAKQPEESVLNISWASCDSDIFCTESDRVEESCKTETQSLEPASLRETKLEWLRPMANVLMEQSHADTLSRIVDTMGVPYEYSSWISLYSISVANNNFPNNLPSDMRLPVLGFDNHNVQRTRPTMPVGECSMLIEQLPIHLQGAKRQLHEDYIPYLSAMCRAESARVLNNDKRRCRSINYLKDKGFDIDNKLNKTLCNLFFDD